MKASIGIVFACAGHPVTRTDVDAAALAQAHALFASDAET